MRYRRRAPAFLAFLTVGILATALAIVHAHLSSRSAAGRIEAKRGLVDRLGLTDLCLFTDARYTRHPAMADVNSAFQDHPLSFEHFPSGSLLPPPAHLKGHGPDR